MQLSATLPIYVGNMPFQIGALFVVGDAQLVTRFIIQSLVYRFPLTFGQIGAHV